MKFTKKELDAFLPMYAATFVSSIFAVVAAYFMVYFLQNGLTYFQVSILLSVSWFTTVFLEIPTGAIADLYGRKFSTLLSYFTVAIIFFLVTLSFNFYYLLILFVIWGVADTFSSGAREAWAISRAKGNHELVETFYARQQGIINLGFIISPLLASFIVTKGDMFILWPIHGFGLFIGGIILLFAKENFKRRKVAIKDSFKETIQMSKASITYSSKHPVIGKIIFGAFFISLTIFTFNLLVQPYLLGYDIPVEYFGYILSFVALVGVVTPYASRHFARKFVQRSRYLSVLLTAFMIALFSAYFISTALGAIILIIVISAFTDFIRPMEEPFFQKFVPHTTRATVTSFKSSIESLGVAIITPIFGLLVDAFGAQKSMTMLGFLLFPAIAAYMKIKKH